MTLDQYRAAVSGAIDPLVDAAERVGMTPDAVSVAAMALALLAGVAFTLAGDEPLLYLLGAVCVFLNGSLDVLDGELARRLGTASRFGDLLDHVLDRYADIAVIVGLAAGVGQYALGLAAVTGVLMTSYLGTQVQAVGLDRAYGGLVGRADRLVLVALTATAAALLRGTLFGLTVVGWLLVFFAVVGHLTALQRFYYALRDLR